jgi:hypothetical protein
MAATILFNMCFAKTRPFYELYNRVLNYVNEAAFFFFLATNMSFTDFVTDIPTRNSTGNLLTFFMFAILAINVLTCLYSSVIGVLSLKTNSHVKPVLPAEQFKIVTHKRNDTIMSGRAMLDSVIDLKEKSSGDDNPSILRQVPAALIPLGRHRRDRITPTPDLGIINEEPPTPLRKDQTELLEPRIEIIETNKPSEFEAGACIKTPLDKRMSKTMYGAQNRNFFADMADEALSFDDLDIHDELRAKENEWVNSE